MFAFQRTGLYNNFGHKAKKSEVDADNGFVHKIIGTAVNVHDVIETSKLIRDDDSVVYGDSGYSGAAKRPEIKNDKHLSSVEFRTNWRPSSIKVPDTYKGINPINRFFQHFLNFSQANDLFRSFAELRIKETGTGLTLKRYKHFQQ